MVEGSVTERVYVLCYEALGGSSPPIGPPLHVKVRQLRELAEKTDAFVAVFRARHYGRIPDEVRIAIEELEATRAKLDWLGK